MNPTAGVCAFLEVGRMIGLLHGQYSVKGGKAPERPARDAICGRPTRRELSLGDRPPIEVCEEHYEVLIAEGWKPRALPSPFR